MLRFAFYIALRIGLAFALVLTVTGSTHAQKTYAERLGWNKGDRVIILHVDDVGMSYDSNQGAIESIENGVANSLSVMMPCPWVSPIVKYIKEHPEVDAGLHITLTSEWNTYRWGPLAGREAVPGLVDNEGCMWKDVNLVRKSASANEVEREIKAQIKRAKMMGFKPTHLDSHMGTVFSKPGYLIKYIKIGKKEHIPIMFPGGHNTMLLEQVKMHDLSGLKNVKVNLQDDLYAEKLTQMMRLARTLGKKVWNAGLPVLDDLHGMSQEWDFPVDLENTDANLRAWFSAKYQESLSQIKPGITMVIMHCSKTTEVFKEFSGSGNRRKGDMLTMTDPAFRQFLKDQGFILTTWKELMERRAKVGKQRFKKVNEDLIGDFLFSL
ncbi:polysaccharide deacetylase family protein [Solitalea lacus]|uniref:polysaccharide deacetylase family protein n=1 Tax=Solitalea lacus TaxID=2911172 RepID=UPI001EDBD62C|nr:polysaccharide deacetylase family protein [Solitalea lacus]UKJ07391.1 polysaccharide deacetylase family protein [Solitalea lacus]